MRKLKERFHRKHGVVSRIFSMVLALAMIMTMAPAIGGATTAYAASPTIRLYLGQTKYMEYTGCQCLGCRCYGR